MGGDALGRVAVSHQTRSLSSTAKASSQLRHHCFQQRAKCFLLTPQSSGAHSVHTSLPNAFPCSPTNVRGATMLSPGDIKETSKGFGTVSNRGVPGVPRRGGTPAQRALKGGAPPPTVSSAPPPPAHPHGPASSASAADTRPLSSPVALRLSRWAVGCDNDHQACKRLTKNAKLTESSF